MKRHPTLALCVVVLAAAALVAGCGSDTDKITQVPTPLPGDDAPPLMPAGFQIAKANADGFLLRWEPNAELDLAGYRVYMYQPDPERTSAYVLQNPTQLITENGYRYYGDMTAELWFRVGAVDGDGNQSALSGAFRVNTPALVDDGGDIEDVTSDQHSGGSRGGSGPVNPPDGDDGRYY